MCLTENFIWKNNYCKRKISAYFPDNTPRGRKFESLLKTNFRMEVPFEVQGRTRHLMEVTDANGKTIHVELEGDFVRIKPNESNETLSFLYSKIYKEYEYCGCKVCFNNKIVTVSFSEDGLCRLNLEEIPTHTLAAISLVLDKKQGVNIEEFTDHNWRRHERELINWFFSIEPNPMTPAEVYIKLINLLDLKQEINKCKRICIFLESSEWNAISSTFVLDKYYREQQISVDSFSLSIVGTDMSNKRYSLERYASRFVYKWKDWKDDHVEPESIDLEIDMGGEIPGLRRFQSTRGLTSREFAGFCPLEHIFCTLSAMKKQRKLIEAELV